MDRYFVLKIGDIIRDERHNSVESALDAAKEYMRDMPDGTMAKILKIEDIGINIERNRNNLTH